MENTVFFTSVGSDEKALDAWQRELKRMYLTGECTLVKPSAKDKLAQGLEKFADTLEGSETMSTGKCGNCGWSHRDDRHTTYHDQCYFNPPVLLESGASNRPIVDANDKACSKWKERDDEKT